MPFYLGVDGGKSKTLALLAGADGQVAGFARRGCSDQYAVSPQSALDEIAAAVEEAARQAGILPERIDCACFGLAGADWPEDFDFLNAELQRRRLAQQIVVKNDASIALRANIGQGWGVVISGGTHLAAAIRTSTGEEWFSAWFSVDGAGGAYAGQRVFWAVMRAADGRGQPTALTGLTFDHLEKSGRAALCSVPALLRALSNGELDEPFYASLAPLLDQAHLQFRDRVAAQIILDIAADMSRWATGLLERYDLLDLEAPIILSGGLFKSQDRLLVEALTTHIHTRAPRARVHLAACEPVTGALFYAYETAGVPITPEIISRLERLDLSIL